MELKELLAAKRARTRSVYVMLDDGLLTRREQLVARANIAEKQDEWMNRTPEAPQLRAELRDLDVEIEASKTEVTFQAMPRVRWTELVELHTLDDDSGEIDVERFGPAIIAESWVSSNGGVSLADVETMWSTWSAAETEQLYIAAYRVNREVRDIPFTSPGIDATGSSESNLTTAPVEE